MHHLFIDTYANLGTVLHKINPKAKIIFLVIFLPGIIFTPINFKAVFTAYSLCIAGLVFLSKVPLSFIFKRIIHLLPFVIIVSLSALFKKGGQLLLSSCIIKSILSLVLVLIISSTTRFNCLAGALKELGVPKLFIDLLSFMYRYAFLLEDQLLRARRAYLSRGARQKSNFRKARVLSNILGSLFIRTYERAERVYLAMCSRGYSHEADD